ncbi:alpha/beta fold hydrolase [Rhodococcus olei]|uniref:Alpha/beta fold hydrolase n=1 Tax=Rhodococcus olei TaxID=2161675 RepID=A0ABP8NTQ8_9NOCA
MGRQSALEFAATGEGAAFHGAYDRVLGKWPGEVDTIDLASEYGTTRVNMCGPVGAPSVVLLPGAGATSTVWFANVAALAERFRVHAVDRIGDAGRSIAGRPVRSVDDLMSWLGTVVAGAGLGTFGLVGHSYGGMVALAYALRAPDRIRKLVLIDPNSCFAGMRAQYLARAAPLLLCPTEKRQRDFIRWETNGQEVDADWLELMSRGAAHFPKSKTVVPKRPGRAALDALDVDTTVVLAGRSKVHDSGTLGVTIATRFPRVDVITLDGATHHTVPMYPAAEFNAALVAALDR